MSFRNDNLIITNSEGDIKLQCTCYRLFLVYAIGNFVITSGLMQRAEKFGFHIALFTAGFRYYGMLGSRKDGNTLLKERQYSYDGIELAKHIVTNKIITEIDVLKANRNRINDSKVTTNLLKDYIEKVQEASSISSIMGYEGLAAKVYFKQHFDNIRWYGRQPRIKRDIPNSMLDVGYTILFAYIEALLTAFGFDTYIGVLHQQFYMRKSLVCDIVEPFRYLIDKEIRKGFNLGQIKEEDFTLINSQYRLNWKVSPKYIALLMKPILGSKDEIFVYIQQYYRCFMKGVETNKFPIFREGCVTYDINKL